MVMESSYPDGSIPVVGGVFPPEHLPLPVFTANGCSPLLGDPNANSLSEIFLDQYTEVDLSSEWLSSFVEECLSSAGNCLNLTTTATTTTEANTTVTNPNPSSNSSNSKGNINSPQKTPSTYRNSGVPGKPRSQRKRRMTSTNNVVDPSSKTHKSQLIIWPDQYHHHLNPDAQLLQLGFSDPPLLEQAYWLADSELILPQKEGEEETKESKDCGEEEENEEEEEQQKKKKKKMVGKKKGGGGEEVFEENNGGGAGEQQPRRCSHCQAQKTPQWRAGPLGPKTLCNACGVRYFKSGRLLPEYRPAKSPTFVSYKHSNSHKKVLQMRMAILDDSNLV